ncbi:hypothetical protein PIB30_008702 [Stylosanthes scabra]|uniref:Uncharacterized protein n=1 Tax=Stylosanthes scabra TaxID=79078 RepID=A0ABU6U575_9FABA|nr:hypothetical protein [Stylosanthes scabra]
MCTTNKAAASLARTYAKNTPDHVELLDVGRGRRLQRDHVELVSQFTSNNSGVDVLEDFIKEIRSMLKDALELKQVHSKIEDDAYSFKPQQQFYQEVLKLNYQFIMVKEVLRSGFS